jgi:hypothetical protein
VSETAVAARRPGLYSTYVGKKYAMAVSGLVLLLFVLVHMLGNLKLYLGATALNDYAAWLRTVGEPLLPRRALLSALEVVLLAAVAVHMHARVLGDGESLNQSLEKAGRVGDFLELAELMCRDALHREESCGGHFRTEHQTPDHEALRDDDDFAHVAVWEHRGADEPDALHKEPLTFQNVHPTQRSYA